jgi:hypothetical protein
MPYDPGDPEMPMVSEFALTPPADGWRGGTCYVRLMATDNVKVKDVTARLTGPGAPTDAVVLSLVSGTVQYYQGSVTVPANTNADGKDNTYYVTAWAKDDAGNTTSVEQSLSFTVPGAETPPGPPTW